MSCLGSRNAWSFQWGHLKRFALCLLITAVIAACGGGGGGDDDEPEAPPSTGTPTPTPKPVVHGPVSYDSKGFLINSEYRLLRGGTVQYFRIPESDWRDRLLRFKAGGFNTVDLYVPWNVVEEREGVFDFTKPNLAKFLNLCKELGLYVYFRPGPYITNEMNGGGIPSWLSANATKKTISEDGKPNLRTHDPDFMNYVARYFDKVNAFIKPWLFTNGGPIILYSVENEYSWFEIFYTADVLFTYEGGPERGADATPTTPYFTALRDLVVGDGIDVPITSCPGNGTTDGMGKVAGIVPMPNMYDGLGGERPEQVSYDLLTDMHLDPKQQYNGIYSNMPSGTTETDRDPIKIKRLIMGGLDGTFAFNLFGGSQTGRRNAVVMNARSVEGVVDLTDFNRFITTGSLSPEIGYFHGVIDFDGAVSPSGLMRNKYWAFRRDNMFFDTVERYFGAAERPNRSGSFGGADSRVSISSAVLGATNSDSQKVHYWLDAGNGVYFLSIVNETGSDQVLPINGIQSNGLSYPRYVAMTVPVFSGGSSKHNSMILPQNFPIEGVGSLRYTTAELVTARSFNGERLLAFHGKPGTNVEISLGFTNGAATAVSVESGVTVRENGNGVLTATVSVDGYRSLLFTTPSGTRVRVLVTETDDAGRLWFLNASGRDVMVGGPDYVDSTTLLADSTGFSVSYEHDSSARELVTLTPAGYALNAQGLTQTAARDAMGITRYDRPSDVTVPTLPAITTGAVSIDDTAEAAAAFDASSWQSWSGEPRSLDSLGIYAGHAWYRTEFNLTSVPTDANSTLFVNNASDFVGIYVNGTYLTQVAPMGTEIDSNHRDADYRFPNLAPYLTVGRNVIAFRTEVWGHGSFMFPRGKLNLFGILPFGGQIPAVGFDAVKGLLGTAWVGGETSASRIPLTNWRVRASLGGELAANDFPNTLNTTAWSAQTLPMQLSKGQIRWYRTNFDRSAFPDPTQLHAPVVLALQGERVKATVWLNGEIIGRWLSDDGNGSTGWLRHGFWGRGINNMWMNTPANHFPISTSTLKATGNVLSIAFEDMSRDNDATAGRVTSIGLEYARENKQFDLNGNATLVSAPKSVKTLTLR